MTISVVKAATNFASFSATVTASIATGSGSYRKARAWLGCSADTVPVPSTVTIGADSLTIVGAQQTGPGTGGMKWRLFESTSDLTVTGTQTATGTVSVAPGSGGSILLVEIYQSTAGSLTFGTPVFSNPESGSAGSISSSVTAAAADKVVMLLREASGSTISATSPGTLNTDLGTTFAASVIRDGAGGSTAVGVAFSGSYGVIAAAYSISEPGASDLTGGFTLADLVFSGTFATGALSQLAGGITLDDFLNGGVMGLAPGIVTTEPFKNWSGTLLPGVTVPNVVFLKLDRTTAVALVNQTTAGDGVMTVANAALVAGTFYIMVSFDATGASIGAELVQAT